MSDDVATLARLAEALAGTTDPVRGARAAAAVLRAGLNADQVTVWRMDRAANALRPVADDPASGRAGALPVAPAALEREAAGFVRRIERHGVLLGAIEVLPAGAARESVLGAAIPMLALQLGAIRTAEEFALEVAERNRETADAWQFANLVIDSLPVGLYVVDREYRIRIWNRKRETGTQGLRRQDAVGRAVFDVLTRQPEQELRAEFDRVFEDGVAMQGEASVETPQGIRVFRQTRLPMRLGADAVTHVITIGEDMTEWRAAEQRMLLNEKLAAVGQLAAGVMHEINNPLATISASLAAIEARLADAPTADPAVGEYLGLMAREVERCTGIVDGLLDFSRPRAQVKAPADLNLIVEEALTLLQPQQRFRHVRVTRALAPALPAVLVNRAQILQVIVSLLLNAADAMNGVGAVTVSSGYADDGGVRLAVADSGPGIPAEVRPRIFEPFFTTKAPGRGTGLGLSICYGIVREHHGRIEVASEAGAGATFLVTLPAAEESA